MSLLVILAGLALMSIPVAVSATRLRSEAKVRTSCTAIAGGFIVFGFGLTITASPLLILWHDGDSISGLTHLSPGGRWAWAAGAALVFLAALLTTDSFRATLTSRRRVYAASLLASAIHHDPCNVSVHIVPIDEVLALAAPSPTPHVVVSQALRDMLDSTTFDAVVAHEAAHLRLRHDRHLFLLSFYTQVWGWLPRVHSIVGNLRNDIEKWADTHAVKTGTTDPQTLATAIEAVARASGTANRADDGAWERAATLRIVHNCDPPRLQQIAVTLLTTTTLAGSTYATTHSLVDLGAIIAAIH